MCCQRPRKFAYSPPQHTAIGKHRQIHTKRNWTATKAHSLVCTVSCAFNYSICDAKWTCTHCQCVNKCNKFIPYYTFNCNKMLSHNESLVCWAIRVIRSGNIVYEIRCNNGMSHKNIFWKPKPNQFYHINGRSEHCSVAQQTDAFENIFARAVGMWWSRKKNTNLLSIINATTWTVYIIGSLAISRAKQQQHTDTHSQSERRETTH